MTDHVLTGKTALVTGAGSGIGREIALTFARNGAQLVLAGRRRDALEETGALIRKIGGDFLAVATDVTDEAAVEALLDQAVARFSSVDVAVNGAGVFQGGTIDSVDHAAFAEVFAINVTGAWLCMKHEIRTMKKQGGGVIVNVCSALGAHVTLPEAGVYGATKAALTALTRAAALENIDHNIRINAISPGPFDTTMSLRPGEDAAGRRQRMETENPSKRVGRLDEIGAAILWLCTGATYMVGQDLVIDGGVSA